MPRSNYPRGFANGVNIREMPITQTNPGQVFWVYNGTALQSSQRGGSDQNKGTYDSPFATLNYALTQTLGGRGDIILIKAGHTETISAAAGLAIANGYDSNPAHGVAIIGLGTGSLRPTFTLGTANTASITVAASNVLIQNLLFVANFLNIATCFDVVNAQVATDLTIDRCEFRDKSAILNFVKTVRIGTTANIADGLTYTNNKVVGTASSPAAGTTAISSSSTIDRLTASGNVIEHNVLLNSTAALLAMGANDLTHVFLSNNTTVRPNTTSTGELLSTSSTASTGIIADNYCGTLSANGLVAPTGTKLSFINNYCMITGAADKSALVNPAAV